MAVTGRTRRPRPSLGRMIPGVGVTAVVAFLVIDLILVSAAVTRTGGGSADEGTAAPAPSATSIDETRLTTMYVTPARIRASVPPSVSST